MRKKIRIHVRPRYILLVLVILCFVLMFISYRYGEMVRPVREVAGDVITPMQTGINTFGSDLYNKLEYLKKMDDLIAENRQLNDQLAELTTENKILLQNRYELDDFRSLYDLDVTYADYHKVAARVIFNNTNNWYSSFQIDKGSDDGIKVGMNVMAGNGLVGIVTSTGHNYATVRSIIDDASQVSGMILKTSDNCYVKGDLALLEDGYIRVTDIKKDAQITEGDEVVTSFISPKYHPGILIGYISNIRVDPSNMTKSAYLTPAVDFSNLDMVLIITEEKEELY